MKALALLELIKMMGVDGDISIVINEAITELEELENRSCKNCKHHGEYEYEISGAEDFTRVVRGCTLMLKIFEDGFCCNKWIKK